jgi:glycosyltransferase involved in cell wall biosynthesis
VNWAATIDRPAALIVGGSDLNELADDPARGARIRETLGRADLVYGVGQGICDRLRAVGVPTERVRLLERGVDRNVFFPAARDTARAALDLPEHRPVLLWVGRMVPVKGLDVLFDALEDPGLGSSQPLLVLVGEGPLRASLESRAAAMRNSDTVRFVGSVPHSELPRWYAAADLLVLPSRSEGVPNVLLEGLACSRRFVASDVGSIAAIAPEPEGDLVPAGDSKALAERLADRLAHPPAAAGIDSSVKDSRECVSSLAQELTELALRGRGP